MTVINGSYSFNCSICKSEVSFEEIDKGATFAAYELVCGKCSNSSYMFSIFVPTREELMALIERYKYLSNEIARLKEDQKNVS